MHTHVCEDRSADIGVVKSRARKARSLKRCAQKVAVTKYGLV